MKAFKKMFCFLMAAVLVFGALPVETMAASAYSLEQANIEPIDTQAYTGLPVMPDVDVALGGKTLSEGRDYELSYSDNTEIGAASVTVTGRGDYQGERTVHFYIGKEDISGATVTGVKNFTWYYANFVDPYEQNITVTLNGKTLVKDVDYEVWYYDNVGVGTATMKIVGIGNYYGSITKEFTLTAAAPSTSYTSMTLSSGNSGRSVTIYEGDGVSFHMTNLNTDGFTASYTVRNSSYSTVDSGSVSSCQLSDSGKQIGSYKPLSTGTYTVQYKVTGYTMRQVMVAGQGYQYFCYPKSYGTTYSQTVVVKPRVNTNVSSGSVTGITFDKVVESGLNELELKVNVAVTPTTPSVSSKLTWTTSNSRVATVDSTGTVTIVGPGTASIQATAPNGISLTIPVEIAPIQLDAVTKGVSLYRTDRGYELSLCTSKGMLEEGRDYTVEYEESGSSVTATITGCGQFSGELTYTFERPITGDYTGTLNKSGDFIVDICPDSSRSPVRVLVASLDGNGKIVDIFSDYVEELGSGYTNAVDIDPAMLGTYKVFFLDADTMAPLCGSEEISTIIQPTYEERYAAYQFMRDYTIDNATKTSPFYVSSFYSDGLTVGLRYYISGSSRYQINICMSGNGYAINYYMSSSSFDPSFSYSCYLDNGEYCSAYYRLDPVRHIKGGEPTSIAYYSGGAQPEGEEAELLCKRAMTRFDNMIDALGGFLEKNGYSLNDIGMCSFYAQDGK